MADTTNQAQDTQQTNDGDAQKTFTQAEVNQIISERLSRERAKTEPTQEQMRVDELNAREAKLSCKEYLLEKGYDSRLLDVLDTSSPDTFRQAADLLQEIAAEKETPIKIVGATPASGTGGAKMPDPIASAFKLKR